MKPATKLSITSMVVGIIPAVYLGNVYGWKTVLAIVLLFWANNMSNHAAELLRQEAEELKND